jgi:lysine 2,3-aminomutase
MMAALTDHADHAVMKGSVPPIAPTAPPAVVTDYYLSLADRRDPADPILAQCLPSAAEIDDMGTGEDDPLDEERFSPLPCLIHRYPDRVLLLTTSRCFVRCRHCNRRRLWERPGEPLTDAALEAIRAYLVGHPSVREVILSGGDPLTLPNDRLDRVLATARSGAGVEAVRIGTRAPVVYPERIDDELCEILARHAPVWINTQFNHPREVTRRAGEACLRLLRAGCPVGNQTVLLRGVNDSAAIQARLCRELQRWGIRPYYLFLCENVRGVRHFRTGLAEARAIIGELRRSLGGLAVPNLVVDLPHGQGKVILQPDPVIARDGSRTIFRGFDGNEVEYLDP